LLKLAESRAFRPIPLGIRIKTHLPTKIRELDTHNVAAVVRGSERPDEVVIYSAHWDHLGVGQPVNGDAIYNGAVDNATGVAMLLEMARAWAALPRKPRRSALFLAVTAEEGGLRGSEYYATHPLFPVEKTAVNLNFDSFYPAGRPAEVVVPGADRTTVWPLVQEAARRFQLEIKPDLRPENGGYFRSDHFPFAKVGIPAFSVKPGAKLAADVSAPLAKLREGYPALYHQPGDEYHEEWDFTGLEHMARFGFLLGVNVANLETLPARAKLH
jgi:Zn-dependent M28 family amino/carboxypeptidase